MNSADANRWGLRQLSTIERLGLFVRSPDTGRIAACQTKSSVEDSFWPPTHAPTMHAKFYKFHSRFLFSLHASPLLIEPQACAFLLRYRSTATAANCSNLSMISCRPLLSACSAFCSILPHQPPDPLQACIGFRLERVARIIYKRSSLILLVF